MIQRRRFQATVNTFRTVKVLNSLFKLRSQILAGYTPPWLTPEVTAASRTPKLTHRTSYAIPLGTRPEH